MKEKVLSFLSNLPEKREERFNQAIALLSKTPTANQILLRNYNNIGANEKNISNIIYDLKKAYSISELMVRTYKAPKSIIVLQGDVDKGQKDLLSAQVEKTKEITKEETTEKTSLHVEFPFLKEANCPPELHIISGALVASYKRYEDAKAQLDAFKEGKLELSPDEDLEITKTAQIEFHNNQQLYNELVYFKENEKLLAEHHILKEYRWKKQFEAMTNEEMFRYKNNAKSYISKYEPELQQENIEEKRKQTLLEKIDERKYIVSLIDIKLNAGK